MVFQNYALYPYLTVEANIGFPLKVARVKKSVRDERVREVAKLLGLEEYLHRKPGQLSGGQRQRVAMGRAIVRLPKVFLMDEPLSNLDAKLRVQMRADIASLQADFGITTVYVTHDQSEAMTLGHRVAVLKDGLLQQCDAPRVLYEQPANTFVAGFIGSPSMNLLTVPLGSNGAVSLGGVPITLPEPFARRARQAAGASSSSASARSRSSSRQTGSQPRCRSSRKSAPTRFSSAPPSSTARRRGSSRGPPRSGRRRAASGSRSARWPSEAHLFDPVSGSRLG